MDDLYRLARQRIVFLLQAGHPEPGARLKQRLQREFEKEGLRFDERRWHFAKFSDFVAANNDIVAIERPAGPGDIVLRLRPDATSVVTGASQEQVEPGSRESGAPVIPSEIWQAFANPDPRRKRFLSRSSSQVVHFVDGENSRQQHEVARASSALSHTTSLTTRKPQACAASSASCCIEASRRTPGRPDERWRFCGKPWVC